MAHLIAFFLVFLLALPSFAEPEKFQGWESVKLPARDRACTKDDDCEIVYAGQPGCTTFALGIRKADAARFRNAREKEISKAPAISCVVNWQVAESGYICRSDFAVGCSRGKCTARCR